MAISRITWVSRNQNVSILDFIGAEDDGGVGDNWSNKTPVKMSPPTYHHPNISTGRMPFLSPNQQCQSTEWSPDAKPTTLKNRRPSMIFTSDPNSYETI